MSRLLSVLLIIGSSFGADKAGADLRSGIAGDNVLAPDIGKAVPLPRANVLLKLGSMKTDPEFERLAEALQAASQKALGELPGVRLMEASEDADAAAVKRKPPVVMITGKLAELGQKDEGEEVLISAKVEYFVHRMPGESIAAVVSGVASARVAPIQMKQRNLRERLERSLVAAAVASAVKRSAPALKAAVN